MIMVRKEYRITTDINLHPDQETLRAAADDMADVFRKVNTANRQAG